MLKYNYQQYEKNISIDTIAIRFGHNRTNEQEHSEPIFLTSSFVYNSAAEAAGKFSGDIQGNVYSRFDNPTVQIFERRLAACEYGENCVATSSGMSAIMSLVMGILKSGDEIVASRSMFGSTISLLQKYLVKFGIITHFVQLSNIEAWEKAITYNTRLLFAETPSNPLSELVNIQALSKISHYYNTWLVIDNCLCTPTLQRPITLGADIVVHSATKYLDGQGRALGGAVVGRNILIKEIYGVIRICGPCMSPFNAWIFLKGLETLNLRMRVQSKKAIELAKWLEKHTAVEKVYYSGLKSHPQHFLAVKQQKGFGAIIGFEIKGGKMGAWSVIDAIKLISITANLGDIKTTITHPSTTTHGKLSDDQKKESGIKDGLLRISIGLENIEDIRSDLSNGLNNLY
ncbi:O-acetylhomoserine sulfhydrylase [Candidatus Johnevansia muelleri]|uniref:O-succinylhomoserine sulfhydrylase n=1 Tax=Candidatus Johnevansia muelleri TaxID=1495769 RepID=A0A078KI47_9GAMM|nr:O-acetylhomoserine sulfhydrylase [Candidatus Evansia muelleri]